MKKIILLNYYFENNFVEMRKNILPHTFCNDYLSDAVINLKKEMKTISILYYLNFSFQSKYKLR